jgi:hypothetical protein
LSPFDQFLTLIAFALYAVLVLWYARGPAAARKPAVMPPPRYLCVYCGTFRESYYWMCPVRSSQPGYQMCTPTPTWGDTRAVQEHDAEGCDIDGDFVP